MSQTPKATFGKISPNCFLTKQIQYSFRCTTNENAPYTYKNT